MYKIKYLPTGKFIFTNHSFFTYERARQAARKHARKMVATGKLKRNIKTFGYWDDVSRQPTMLSNVYDIVRMPS